jgi:hypothetical protein
MKKNLLKVSSLIIALVILFPAISFAQLSNVHINTNIDGSSTTNSVHLNTNIDGSSTSSGTTTSGGNYANTNTSIFQPTSLDSTSSTTNNTSGSSSSAATTTASVSCTSTGIGKIICQVKQILDSIVPILVALGLVYFVWGVVQFVIADGEEAKTKGKDRMIYGIIGFVVIVGMWGIVNLVVNTFGLSSTTAPTFTPVAGTGSGCSAITSSSTFQNVLCYLTGIINNSIIPLIFALATAMFVWGVVNFLIINSGEEAKREQGKQFMIWGVIALAVMLSVWGLVGILGTTFGLTVNALPHVTPPQ